jgi:hypothetical protein
MFKYILKSFWRIISVILVAGLIFGGILLVFYVLSTCTITQVCWIMGGLGVGLILYCGILDGYRQYVRENTEMRAKQVCVLDKCYIDVCCAAAGKKIVDSDINIATATMINELHRYGKKFGWDDTFRSYVDRLKNVVEPLGLSV